MKFTSYFDFCELKARKVLSRIVVFAPEQANIIHQLSDVRVMLFLQNVVWNKMAAASHCGTFDEIYLIYCCKLKARMFSPFHGHIHSGPGKCHPAVIGRKSNADYLLIGWPPFTPSSTPVLSTTSVQNWDESVSPRISWLLKKQREGCCPQCQNYSGFPI